MLIALLTLLTALAMAGTAAVFAIYGIVAIFAGMPAYALVMGSVIEAGKLTAVSWVYRNWDQPTNLKYYLIPFIFVAMLLTSLGIFGLLSKAHLEQTSPVLHNEAIVERIDQQISREQKQVDDAEAVITQMDHAVTVLLNANRISGPNGARAVRAGQQEERQALRDIILTSQSEIDQLAERQLELTSQLRTIELEVGPIKYVAEMVYGDGEDRLDEAVRWVIIMFIFVFDPMAILLLMAANYSFMTRNNTQPAPRALPEIADIVEAKVAEHVAPVAPVAPVISTRFLSVQPSEEESPEDFVKRVVGQHGSPDAWFYSPTHHALQNQSETIAESISSEDAASITELAKRVLIDQQTNFQASKEDTPNDVVVGNVGKRYRLHVEKIKDRND